MAKLYHRFFLFTVVQLAFFFLFTKGVQPFNLPVDTRFSWSLFFFFDRLLAFACFVFLLLFCYEFVFLAGVFSRGWDGFSGYLLAVIVFFACLFLLSASVFCFRIWGFLSLGFSSAPLGTYLCQPFFPSVTKSRDED